jgi:tripartite-type tricarboxylate transporter receptor subunit TctC
MIAKYLLLITEYLSVVPGSAQWASLFLLGDCAELSERPVKLIVCFPAGGPIDPMTRFIAQPMLSTGSREYWNVVEMGSFAGG